MELFHYQAKYNKIYRTYIKLLNIDSESVGSVKDIPHLPISFFKSHQVVTGEWDEEIAFSSSGTTGQEYSTHLIKELEIYKRSLLLAFKLVYGEPREHVFLCILPNYLENPNSSLIFMTDTLIKQSGHELSGYYLDSKDKLAYALKAAYATDRQVILLGVSYALLDLARRRDLPNMEDVIVMETGGTKGRGPEIVKAELHKKLQEGFGVKQIHSEYGMTELLSQTYSTGEGKFNYPPWMRVSVRDVNDPFNQLEAGRSGGLNIIDLANLHSCAFIATQDLGRVYEDCSFELLGRFDHSDIRGCNLLVAN